jgi:hypothetical protein
VSAQVLQRAQSAGSRSPRWRPIAADEIAPATGIERGDLVARERLINSSASPT